jgi:hypothetical protein
MHARYHFVKHGGKGARTPFVVTQPGETLDDTWFQSAGERHRRGQPLLDSHIAKWCTLPQTPL